MAEQSPATAVSFTNMEKLSRRDIAAAMATYAADIGSDETRAQFRYMVNQYYMMQENRKRTDNQLRSAGIDVSANSVLQYLSRNSHDTEKFIKTCLDFYTSMHPVGIWMKDITGIGPVISAGILAHIDIRRCPTSGHIESFAGYNPTVKWEKGQKRPFNMALKTLLFHAGMGFIKNSGKDKCVYGKWYLAKKKEYMDKNEAGEYSAQAEYDLLHKYKDKNTSAYKSCKEGKLPQAQILARARRWTIKLFVSHLHEHWYTLEFGEPPAKPYAIAILGHAHHIRFGDYPADIIEVADDEDIRAAERELADKGL